MLKLILYNNSMDCKNAHSVSLQWERKKLAHDLKHTFTNDERERLFQEWGINPYSKERKLQLVNLLWSPPVVSNPDGARRSAELVKALVGMDSAAEQFMQLVFGSTDGKICCLVPWVVLLFTIHEIMVLTWVQALTNVTSCH